MSSTRRVLVSFVCALLACEGGRASVDDASAGLQRHRAAFVVFDRWVRRAMQGAELFADERALAEALFAKARAERSVVAAWVEQTGSSRIAVSLPHDAPPPSMTGALRLRDAELGTLEVLLGAACPGRAASALDTTAQRCVLVACSAAGPHGPLRVTVAFDDQAAAPVR